MTEIEMKQKMAEFEEAKKTNPRQAALDQARAFLTAAAWAAQADCAMPMASNLPNYVPEFIVEIPADTKNGHRFQHRYGRCPCLAHGPSQDRRDAGEVSARAGELCV